MVHHGGGKSGVVGMCGTEYLELIEAAGCEPEDYPTCQPVGQHQIWQRVLPEDSQPEAVEKAIQELKQMNPNFHMDGASWSNHINWLKGYENVLSPMNLFSSLFHQKVDNFLPNNASEYRNLLLHNLLLQTSCFRYWGQGTWTDYAREIYQRGAKLL